MQPRLKMVVVLTLVLVASGCSHAFDTEGQLAGSIADVAKCSSDLNDVSSEPLPAGFPMLRHSHAYRYQMQNSTQFWFTTLPGSSSTLVSTREEIRKQLTSSGYTEISKDQELGYEADFAFAGRYIGTVQVRPLCHGRIRVRYAMGPGAL